MHIDLNRPMDEIRAELSKYPVKTRVMLTGPMVVARDIAHAKIKERLDAGEPMPQYLQDHCVYYAGPAKTPEGYASGSFGPTTAGRMDSYVEQFQAAGGSMVMLAKGNRSKQVTDACATHGGFYLGSIGGPAARLALDNIKQVEVLEYPELGMEAVWKIEVVDFPAFIVVDDKGNDFFEEVRRQAEGRADHRPLTFSRRPQRPDSTGRVMAVCTVGPSGSARSSGTSTQRHSHSNHRARSAVPGHDRHAATPGAVSGVVLDGLDVVVGSSVDGDDELGGGAVAIGTASSVWTPAVPAHATLIAMRPMTPPPRVRRRISRRETRRGQPAWPLPRPGRRRTRRRRSR